MYAHLRRTIPSGVLSLCGRVMAFSLSDCRYLLSVFLLCKGKIRKFVTTNGVHAININQNQLTNTIDNYEHL